MAPPPKRPEPAVRLYHFAFSKLQIGMMVAGLAVLMTLSFSLGFVTARRQGAERRLAQAPAGPAEDAKGTSATVRLPEAGGKPPATEVEPGFYKALVAQKPEKGPAPLEPIRLPDGEAAPAPAPETKAHPPAPAREAAKGAPAPAREARPAPAPHAYTIQVLSVREYERAERVLRELRRRGVYGYIERTDLKEKGVWYRLRVGRYPSREGAERALAGLRARGSLRKGSVVPL